MLWDSIPLEGGAGLHSLRACSLGLFNGESVDGGSGVRLFPSDWLASYSARGLVELVNLRSVVFTLGHQSISC
jgi:hypothetical protein